MSTYSEAFDKVLKLIYNSSMKNYKLKIGFTLAEVLITLGIIGVVAAMTIPTISHNIQHAVFKNQFKKFYSTFYQAILATNTRHGSPLKCHYWLTGEYSSCTAVCVETNEYGTCQRWECDNGDALPGDYNGPMTECSTFTEEMFFNTLKTTKICKDHAYEQGCLPEDFRGKDIVQSEQNPDENYDPNASFADAIVKNNYPVFVLADGTYIIGYKRYPITMPVFVVDINGNKGPNKWGYDIFQFAISGNINGKRMLVDRTTITEAGGKTFQEMYDECFK